MIIPCFTFGQVILLLIILTMVTSILPDGSFKTNIRSIASTILFTVWLVNIFAPKKCSYPVG